MSEYFIPAGPGEAEFTEKRSRFLGHIRHVDSEEEAKAFVNQIKKEHYDARHNCWCYLIKDGPVRYSDDGEPQGTAGMPVLDVLRKNDCVDAIIVVVRYFGGTLLGTGGLVRAYQKATQEGLAHSTVIEKQQGRQITIATDYNGLGKLQYLVAKNGITTMDTRYTDSVELDVMCPLDTLDRFLAEVIEATSGKADIDRKEAVEFAILDGEVLVFE